MPAHFHRVCCVNARCETVKPRNRIVLRTVCKHNAVHVLTRTDMFVHTERRRSLCRTCRQEDADFRTLSDGSRPDWFWTGRAPTADAPGMQDDGTLTSLPQPNFRSSTKQDVLDYFDNTWLITEVIFSGVLALLYLWGIV